MVRRKDFEWNMAELVRIANVANEQLCKPLAEKVAERARGRAPVATGDYKASIGVETEPRSGVDDWAHSYVVATDDKAMLVESRTGNLARALTGTSRAKEQRASRKERREHVKAYNASRKAAP